MLIWPLVANNVELVVFQNRTTPPAIQCQRRRFCPLAVWSPACCLFSC